mmetsp:Transcript_34617/g.80910  ORF Transcript_34617/g.80910 Transcript_34617/m.80910 type:complete len:301 (-) Transcript_34617:204-1106(-)
MMISCLATMRLAVWGALLSWRFQDSLSFTSALSCSNTAPVAWRPWHRVSTACSETCRTWYSTVDNSRRCASLPPKVMRLAAFFATTTCPRRARSSCKSSMGVVSTASWDDPGASRRSTVDEISPRTCSPRDVAGRTCSRGERRAPRRTLTKNAHAFAQSPGTLLPAPRHSSCETVSSTSAAMQASRAADGECPAPGQGSFLRCASVQAFATAFSARMLLSSSSHPWDSSTERENRLRAKHAWRSQRKGRRWVGGRPRQASSPSSSSLSSSSSAEAGMRKSASPTKSEKLCTSWSVSMMTV